MVSACRQVTGAGVGGIDGTYLPVSSLYDGVAAWQFGTYGYLRRQSGTWYIMYGNSKYYYAASGQSLPLPPVTGWLPSPQSYAPAPTVTNCGSTDDGSPRNVSTSRSTSTVAISLNSDWTDKLPKRTRSSSCRAANGRVIIVGGISDTSTPVNTVSLYDPTPPRWYVGVAALNELSGPVNVGVANGNICVFYGGIVDINTAVRSNQVHRFDLSGPLDSLITIGSAHVWWSKKAPSVGNLYSPAVIATNNGNGLIIAAGGRSSSSSSSSANTAAVHFYNATSDTWLANGALTIARANAATATLGNWVYFIGGSNTGVGYVDMYHMTTLTRQSQTMPYLISRAGMACVGHEAIGKIFCSGGYDPSTYYYEDTMFAYFPGAALPNATSGTWAVLTGAFLSTPRYGHTAFLFQSRILFTAGTSSAKQSYFDIFDPYLYTSMVLNDSYHVTTTGGVIALQFADPSQMMFYGGEEAAAVIKSTVTSIQLMEYTWHFGEWSRCIGIETCGDTIGHRELAYTCRDQYNNIVDNSKCAHPFGRIISESCVNYCPSHWQIFEWSSCTKSCASGIQTRRVECHDDATTQIRSDLACLAMVPGAKPTERQSCNTFVCPTWSVGSWSDCSVTCGDGVETRTYYCHDWQGKKVDNSECPQVPIETSRACNNGACPYTSSGTSEVTSNGAAIGIGVAAATVTIAAAAIVAFCCYKRYRGKKGRNTTATDESVNGVPLTRSGYDHL